MLNKFKPIVKWILENTGRKYREFNLNSVMVDTDYEGTYAPPIVYDDVEKIRKYLARFHPEIKTESRGSHTGLLLTDTTYVALRKEQYDYTTRTTTYVAFMVPKAWFMECESLADELDLKEFLNSYNSEDSEPVYAQACLQSKLMEEKQL